MPSGPIEPVLERAVVHDQLVFEVPAIHMFDVGRLRDETMAFPPGVTVQDRKTRGTRSI
jgi:hypothetical protein